MIPRRDAESAGMGMNQDEEERVVTPGYSRSIPSGLAVGKMPAPQSRLDPRIRGDDVYSLT